MRFAYLSCSSSGGKITNEEDAARLVYARDHGRSVQERGNFKHHNHDDFGDACGSRRFIVGVNVGNTSRNAGRCSCNDRSRRNDTGRNAGCCYRGHHNALTRRQLTVTFIPARPGASRGSFIVCTRTQDFAAEFTKGGTSLYSN